MCCLVEQSVFSFAGNAQMDTCANGECVVLKCTQSIQPSHTNKILPARNGNNCLSLFLRFARETIETNSIIGKRRRLATDSWFAIFAGYLFVCAYCRWAGSRCETNDFNGIGGKYENKIKNDTVFSDYFIHSCWL